MHLDALEFLDEERRAWRPFEALADLADEQLTVPVEAAHGWSGRQLMGHLLSGHEVARAVATELAVNETSRAKERADADWDARGGEVVNAEIDATWAALSMDELRDRFATLPRELRAYLRVVPESRWLERGDHQRFFRSETTAHYGDHLADLAAILAETRDALEIRSPRIDDAASAAAVQYRSWAATYTPLLGPDQADRLTLAERIAHWEWSLGSQAPHMGSLFAVRSGAIVGLVEWEIGVDADTSAGEIHAIHVALEERGRGVGRLLLDASVEDLRGHGVRRAILWVVEDNSTARAFYERQGWAWDGTRLERPLGGFADFPTVVEVRYSLDLS